mmetsp:Transcript_11046/g.21341  ORF Transcript_11046/g.21341 Transcript_11046/m.21341 type:complete len:90 (-) Transcript_11046:6-275(-)
MGGENAEKRVSPKVSVSQDISGVWWKKDDHDSTLSVTGSKARMTLTSPHALMRWEVPTSENRSRRSKTRNEGGDLVRFRFRLHVACVEW